MPKKKVKKKRAGKLSVANSFTEQPNGQSAEPEYSGVSAAKMTGQNQIDKTDAVIVSGASPSFWQRFEERVEQINKIIFDWATTLYFGSTLILIALLVIQSLTSIFPQFLYFYLIPAVGSLFVALVCGVCFILEIFFFYRSWQKYSDDENAGVSRYFVKILQWTIKRRILWTLIGAVIVSLIAGNQVTFDSLLQFGKPYNPWALALFALAQTLPAIYFLYTAYGIIFRPFLEPFEDLFKKALGITLTPQVSLKRMFGLLVGGSVLYIALMLSASLIDPQIITLTNNLTDQIAEARKELIKNQQQR